MKNTNKTTTTTVKTWHRTLALLLLILIAFSSASCNTVPLPDGTEAHTNAQSEKGTQKQTEAQSEKETQKQTDNIEQLAQIVPFNWEVEERISQEYWEKYCAEGQVEYRESLGHEIEFYGQFEDTYILYIDDYHDYDHIGAYFIEGYEFRFQGRQKLYAYRNGEFLSLEEALEGEIIDVEDLERIHKEYKRFHGDFYKKYYARTVYDVEVILGELEIAIQPAYNGEEYTVEDFADIGCTELVEHEPWNQAPHKVYRYFDIYLDADTEEELTRAVRTLEKRDDIYSVLVKYYWPLDSLPDDSEYGELTSDNYWAINKISLPDAWDIETGSNTVKVGILDTGIDVTHPDLSNVVNTTLSKCFLPQCDCSDGLTDIGGHGTEVAGIIGAQANNLIGVSGVCWNVQLVSLKVTLNGNNINDQAVEAAIDYAEKNGIKILNLSGGVNPTDGILREINEYTGLLICSAGNENLDLEGYHPIFTTMEVDYYPSSFPNDNIFSVGASTPDDTRLSTSNYGAISVDVFAPGVNILTTYPIAKCQNGTCGYDHTAEGAFAEGYHYFQNTSAATPFVAGVAALVMSQPELSYYTIADVKSRILGCADPIDELENLCYSGGRLNAFASVHNHYYEDSYSQHSSNQHKAYCECGEYRLTSHSYTKRYSSIGWGTHKAYCACGAYITESHDLPNPNSSGVATCRKCGYGVQMWGDKPKPELELT